MIGTKKKNLLVILSLVMVFALACSAWAVTGQVRANGVHKDVADDIVTTADDTAGRGIWASAVGGTVRNDGYRVTTSGNSAYGIIASTYAGIDMSGDILTSGDLARGAWSYTYSDIKLNSNVTTNGRDAYGAISSYYSTMTVTGKVTTTGYKAHAVFANEESSLFMTGAVTSTGDEAYGAHSTNNSVLSINGTISTTGYKAHAADARSNSSLDVTGSIVVSGSETNGVDANMANVTVTGDITVNGTKAGGIVGINDSVISMNDGTLKIIDDSSLGIRLENNSVANLTNVTTDADSLLVTSTSGALNAEDSTLVGDILHSGVGGAAGTLEVNLKDSTLEGAILASDGIGNLTGGVVDLSLENSTWFVGGDSSTNGKVTGDINSAIDYTEAPGETTVTIDEIVGNPTITLKPGDQLNITNSTGNNGDFSSSNPDVLEVVTNPDGSVEIISKGEGDADLTYSYTDELGGKHTVTVDGSSSDPHGTGSTPGSSRSGGSSSGCNAGFGVLFALLGLAVVAKKK